MKILRARRTAWLFIVCAAVVPASTGAGAVTGGARDWSYGLGGYARADVRGSDVALRSALQPDGKLVVAGFSGGNPSPGAGIGLARFTKAGILDPTFGSGGRVFIPLHDSFPVGLGVTLKGSHRRWRGRLVDRLARAISGHLPVGSQGRRFPR